MKEKQLFKTFLHAQHGAVKTIDKMYFHPVTQKEGVFYKVAKLNTNPVLYYYAEQSELQELAEN